MQNKSKYNISMFYVLFGHETDPNKDSITQEQKEIEAEMYMEFLTDELLYMYFSASDTNMKVKYEDLLPTIINYDSKNIEHCKEIDELINILQTSYNRRIDFTSMRIVLNSR